MGATPTNSHACFWCTDAYRNFSFHEFAEFWIHDDLSLRAFFEGAGDSQRFGVFSVKKGDVEIFERHSLSRLVSHS
mgnify:FL=1